MKQDNTSTVISSDNTVILKKGILSFSIMNSNVLSASKTKALLNALRTGTAIYTTSPTDKAYASIYFYYNGRFQSISTIKFRAILLPSYCSDAEVTKECQRLQNLDRQKNVNKDASAYELEARVLLLNKLLRTSLPNVNTDKIKATNYWLNFGAKQLRIKHPKSVLDIDARYIKTIKLLYLTYLPSFNRLPVSIVRACLNNLKGECTEVLEVEDLKANDEFLYLKPNTYVEIKSAYNSRVDNNESILVSLGAKQSTNAIFPPTVKDGTTFLVLNKTKNKETLYLHCPSKKGENETPDVRAVILMTQMASSLRFTPSALSFK